MDKKSLQTFTDLEVWKLGHSIVISIYSILKSFPRDEMFGLTSQMKRCSISITSNIAEGFSRQSYREKIQFYSIALGSTTELQYQLLVSRDVGLIKTTVYEELTERLLRVHKMLNGLIRSSKLKIQP